ncbi:MAG: regulatory protein RecX [Lentisphaerae bacterium]|nr:regulatory protein RecX [Lentisphaerota bacterium]MCP4099997.1 regulatory protein RecX [Lentisphaerota bacterium]
MDKQKAMDKALKLLSMRAHSASELRNKLIKKDISKKLADEVIAECSRLNFLNDELFAQDYTAELGWRGCGRYKIKANLRRKGISQDNIEKALSEAENTEEENAKRAMEFKLRTISREKDIRKRREKVYRFLAYRGFPVDIIKKLMDAAPELKNDYDYFD